MASARELELQKGVSCVDRASLPTCGIIFAGYMFAVRSGFSAKSLEQTCASFAGIDEALGA